MSAAERNPYAPPKADVGSGTPEEPVPGRRPALVWVIGLYYIIASVFGAISMYLLWSGNLPLSGAQAEYYHKLNVFDHAISVVSAVCSFGGAVSLLLLKRVAPVFFTANAGLGLGLIAWHIATKGYAAAIGGAGLVGAAIGAGIVIAMCVYSWELRKNGTLK